MSSLSPDDTPGDSSATTVSLSEGPSGLLEQTHPGLASGQWRALSMRDEVSDAGTEGAFHTGGPRRSGALSPDQWPLPTRGRRRPWDRALDAALVDRRAA